MQKKYPKIIKDLWFFLYTNDYSSQRWKRKRKNIPIHIDSDDYVNAILTLGDISEKDGNTVYYNGTHKKNVGNECLSVPFLHGRLQIGFFDKIFHGVKSWKGDRVTIGFRYKKRYSTIL